jgi:electron transport complex protein RnfD
MENKVWVSSSPHIHSGSKVNVIMRDVLIALTPATLAGIYFFGLPALKTIILAVLTAVATEYLIQKFMLKTKPTISDLSAVVTGLLLAFNLPAGVPWYLPVVGSIFAIGIAKQVFGGLGHNFINPALAARAFLMASWPIAMTTWPVPLSDGVTGATPLAILKGSAEGQLPSIMNALIGNVGGCIGETSAILILLGGLYLVYRGVINIRVPLMFVATAFVFGFLLFGFDVSAAFYQIAVGGIMLGAFFMATDYSSTPTTLKGHLIFAFGCGMITMIIRKFGGYPEGVSYSILLMNVATPLIDKYVQPKVFGGGK